MYVQFESEKLRNEEKKNERHNLGSKAAQIKECVPHSIYTKNSVICSTPSFGVFF